MATAHPIVQEEIRMVQMKVGTIALFGLLLAAPVAYAGDTHQRTDEARPDFRAEEERRRDAEPADAAEAQPGTNPSNKVGKPGTRTDNPNPAGDAPLN